ncbi:MAG: hypothetical protein IPJ51_11605 [Saprospiraceae bacterium]|nr:hypothetical protein [Saprospiraceae bacterium]
MITVYKNVLFSILLISLIDNLYAQIKEPLNPLKPKPNWEVWYDKVPVSGDIRVGLMNEFSNSKINPSNFHVEIPTQKASKLCVEISSKDGRYEASLEYDISNMSPGNQVFNLPSSYQEKLSKFEKKDIAILSKAAQSCSSEDYNIYVSSWSNTNAQQDSIYLLVNSENITKFSITNLNGSTEELDCKKLKTNSHIAFNCLCSIPKKYISKSSTFALVQRVKVGSTRKVNSYPVPIKL